MERRTNFYAVLQTTLRAMIVYKYFKELTHVRIYRRRFFGRRASMATNGFETHSLARHLRSNRQLSISKTSSRSSNFREMDRRLSGWSNCYRQASLKPPQLMRHFCCLYVILPPGGHSALLRSVRSLPNAPDRDFPLGLDIVRLGEIVAAKESHNRSGKLSDIGPKRGVNSAISTMWSGSRGGAPFAAACLRLLELAGRPIWPWHEPQLGILGEAFPAAQLCQWDLSHRGYSGPDQIENRKTIVSELKVRASIDPVDERKLLDSADALDAVIAAFAAIAIAKSDVVNFSQAGDEGFIAVAK